MKYLDRQNIQFPEDTVQKSVFILEATINTNPSCPVFHFPRKEDFENYFPNRQSI